MRQFDGSDGWKLAEDVVDHRDFLRIKRFVGFIHDVLRFEAHCKANLELVPVEQSIRNKLTALLLAVHCASTISIGTSCSSFRLVLSLQPRVIASQEFLEVDCHAAILHKNDCLDVVIFLPGVVQDFYQLPDLVRNLKLVRVKQNIVTFA